MNKRIFFSLLLLAAICLGAVNGFSEVVIDNITRPLKSEGPTKVETEIFIIDLDNVDTVNQNFDANVFYRLTWHDPRFAGLDSEKIRIPLNQVWHPHAQLLNQQRVWKTFEDLVDVYPSGKMVYEQRVWGSFSQPLELKEFPFDKQTFNIILVATGYNENEVNFVALENGASGITTQFSVADWNILSWKVGPHDLSSLMGRAVQIASYSLSIEAARKYNYYVIQMMLPLIFIVFMSWMVFWIDPQQTGTQITVAITAMLTLIAFRFTAGITLPRFGYLTKLDYFILAATVQVFAALTEVITSSWLARNQKLDLARRLDRWSRWVFPCSFIVLVWVTLR